MCVGIEIACDLDREALLVEVRGCQVLGAVTRRLRAAARGSERSASGAGRRLTARGSLRLGRLATRCEWPFQSRSSTKRSRVLVLAVLVLAVLVLAVLVLAVLVLTVRVCGNGGQGPRVGQHLQG